MSVEDSIKALEKVVKALAKASVQPKPVAMKTVSDALEAVGWKTEAKEVGTEFVKTTSDKIEKDSKKALDDFVKTNHKAIMDKVLEERLKQVETLASEAMKLGIHLTHK